MTPPSDPNALGLIGEEIALDFLRQRGLKLLQKNYRNRFGEIDLIMQDDTFIAFVEVRLRSSKNFGGALDSIDYHKRSKLIKCAQHYIAKSSGRNDFRFDVVAISPNKSRHEIQWLTNAFDEF
ncbi:MAG: YraN family protein [Cycloclasticus sp.]|nr:YraN family protein [Cycloclasticus sp.]MBQ0790740.1 YraN family protein [Cycloclasticus sp.]